MKAKLVKKLVILATFLIVAVPVFSFALTASAADFGINYAQNLQLANTNQDPRDAAVNIVRYLLTFLGIIAVIVILYGGFVWLTAGGNEDKVGKAKKLIVAGIIGLIVVLAAFVIVQFVIGTTTNILANGNP